MSRASNQLRYVSVYLVMLALVGFVPDSFADDASSWVVRAWQTDDGLLDNDVTGIAQNGEGYLWVSTQGGLNQFDGVKFREIELATSSQRTRPLIRSMLLGASNTLWLALEGGTVIALAPGRTNTFSSTDGLPTFRPSSLAQSADGSVWLGYVDGSACRIASGKVSRYTARNGLWGVGPCVVASDKNGNIWLSKAGQLSLFSNGEINFVSDLPAGAVRMAHAQSGGLWVMAGMALMRIEDGKPAKEIARLDSTAIGISPSVIYEDHEGKLWLGTLAGGLFRLEGAKLFSVPTSYPDIFSITDDREGNLWVGTGGAGLDRLRPRVLDLQNSEDGLPFSSVRSVCEDAAGNIWAAAQNGTLGMQENGEWENVSSKGVWAGTRATAVASDGKAGVWVGTSHDGLKHWSEGQVSLFGRRDGLAGETVRALMMDFEGSLWIAVESPNCVQRFGDGKFQTFSLPQGARTVRAIVQDKSGTIWLGTLDGYLLRVEGDKLVDASAGTLPHRKPIRCLYADLKGDLWIGYAGVGLGRIHGGKFSSLSTGRGLHDAYICAMTLDDSGGFWFSSDHGIFQVRRTDIEEALDGKIETVRSVVYGREESLPSLQGNFGYNPGFVRTREGKIWFPTRAGLVVINPTQSVPNSLAPPVTVERILVDGQPLAYERNQPVKLPPLHRKIEIEFTALSFVAPENVSFRYQLEGWDDNWGNVPRSQRSVSYTRLPAGYYQFKVIACNNAGIWNEQGATLAFEVEPFVWQTWWFRLIILSSMLVAVGGAVRYMAYRKYRARLRKLEQEAALQAERARIAKDIHDELGASLTQISLLGKFTLTDLEEPKKAGEHVEKIASIARQGVKSVDEIVWAVNPRNDNLSQLFDYAGQYAVDFLKTAGIRCRIDFPGKIPERELPANLRHGIFMIIKESLHNAVKHAEATEITFQTRIEGDGLQICITDNGRGFASPKEDALADGLRNMRQRLAEFGGECEIESQPGSGTKVRVKLTLPS